MRTEGAAVVFVLALFGACGQRANEQQPPNITEPASAPVEQAQSAAPPPPATGPDAKTPLSEPRGVIDPKSAEAAGQVVQHYGALIEQHRTNEAQSLWGSNDSASDFAVQVRRYPEVHLELGKPGGTEGAAGSSYVTVPVTFYGRDENGAAFRRPADVILRRVNDVPGSTAAQRRWHIERIEWKNGA